MWSFTSSTLSSPMLNTTDAASTRWMLRRWGSLGTEVSVPSLGTEVSVPSGFGSFVAVDWTEVHSPMAVLACSGTAVDLTDCGRLRKDMGQKIH